MPLLVSLLKRKGIKISCGYFFGMFSKELGKLLEKVEANRRSISFWKINYERRLATSQLKGRILRLQSSILQLFTAQAPPSTLKQMWAWFIRFFNKRSRINYGMYLGRKKVCIYCVTTRRGVGPWHCVTLIIDHWK